MIDREGQGDEHAREDRGAEAGLGPLERRVMEIVWERGSCTVRDVVDQLKDAARPAYTTVMTVMSRLAKKGLLRQEASGRSYLYSPALTRHQYLQAAARRRVRRLLSDFGDLAVAQFVEEVERADPERLRRLGDLLRAKGSDDGA